jgi:hypothetical protein
MNAGKHGHSDDIFSPYSVTFLLIHLGCFNPDDERPASAKVKEKTRGT